MWRSLPLYLLPLFFNPPSKTAMCYHFCFALKKKKKAAMLFAKSVLDRPRPLKMRDIASAGAWELEAPQ